MMIRWKNKNPYINFYRESKRILLSDETIESKENLLKSICSRDYSGQWLFSHPTHKHLGNGVPQEGSDVSKNPYYVLLSHARSVLREHANASEKVAKISKEFAWLSNENIEDWAYNE